MALRLIQAPWTQQPQEAVQPSAWAAQNGVTLLTYGGMLYDAATGRPQSRGLAGAGAVDVVVNSAGIGAVATSSAAAAVLTGRTVFNNAAWTVVVVTSSMPVGMGAWISHVDASGNVVRVGANFDRLDKNANDGSIAVLLLEAGVQRSGCRVAGVLNGEPRAFVVRHVRGSTPRIWVDGTERSVSNPNSDAFTAQPIKSSGDTHVYGNATNGTFAPGGVGNLVAVLGAAVDPAACATLSTIGGAYSALFEPRRIWVPVAAGGATYTLSAPTYAPGSITSTGMTARVTVTAA